MFWPLETIHSTFLFDGPAENLRKTRNRRRLLFCSCLCLAEGGVEAETDIVCGPITVGVAQDGFEQGDGVGESDCTILRIEAVEDAVAEGVEPGIHAAG